MKIIGLLAWYDESPSWLAASVAGFAQMGMEAMVAVDGAYEQYPDGRARSGQEQYEALRETAHGCGASTLIYTPTRLWKDEIEKRSFLFQLAEQIADEDDWYVVFDADEMVIEAAAGAVRKILTETEKVTADCMIAERRDPFDISATKPDEINERVRRFPIRKFFKALPGLRVVGNHYTYALPDGRLLWGNDTQALEPSVLIEALWVEHRSNFRDARRRLQARTYYNRRDGRNAESGPCRLCEGHPKKMGVVALPFDFARTEGGLESEYAEVCEDHIKPLIVQNELRVAALGFRVRDVRAQALKLCARVGIPEADLKLPPVLKQ